MEKIQDALAHYTLLGGQARALLISTRDLYTESKRMHRLTPLTTATLGRTMTAAVLLAADLKQERASITLNIKGGGLVGDIVAVARQDGRVKGYLDYPEVDLPPISTGMQDVPFAVGDSGYLTVVRDSGVGEPYVGRVRMTSGGIAEDFAFYLTLSEQTPSLLALGERLGDDGEVLGAGGLLVQPMPGCSDESLDMLEALAKRLPGIGQAFSEASDIDILSASLLSGLDPIEISVQHPRCVCDCSRGRLERVLISMGVEELESMIAEQNGAQMTCHFCNQVYDFSADELRNLIDEAK